MSAAALELAAMRRRALIELRSTYVIYYLTSDTQVERLQHRSHMESLRYVLGDRYFTWFMLLAAQRERAAA